jgi:hypothetical protein
MASRAYSISGADLNTATTTILGLTSAATIRPEVYMLIISSYDAPLDQTARYQLKRYTAAGTSTGVTPQLLDPNSGAALASAGKVHTVEPTYTSNAELLDLSVYQRVTYRWEASPERELILPSTAANGLGFRSESISNAAFNVNATIHYAE